MPTSLFNENETYTPLANEVYKKASAFATKILDEYPDVLTRDLATVIADAVGMDFTHARVTRDLEKRKSDREAKGAPLERGAE